MPSSTPANPSPPSHLLEVEEADLSSDDCNIPPSASAHTNRSASSPHHSHPSSPPHNISNSPQDDDFVLESSSSSSSPHPDPSRPLIHSPSQSPSPSHSPSHHRPSSSPRPPSLSPHHNSSNSNSHSHPSSPSDNDSASNSVSSDHMHRNGAAHFDSDEPSHLVQKRARTTHDKLVIPTEMRDDDRYFRRSSRARHAPHRLPTSPHESPSSIGSDSDFKAEQANDHEEDEDDDVILEDEEEDDDDDDDDYSARPASKRRSTRSRQPSRRRALEHQQDVEANPFINIPSESDSDGDWHADGSSSKLKPGRRRRSKHTSKRQRPRDPGEDDAVARTARINSRTGDAVNYAESEDDFLASDADPAAFDANAPEEDDHVLRIERVCDYCPIPGRKPLEKGAIPLSDFHPDTVRFQIKWMKKSFRKNSWEILADLKALKGFKKVTNYIKAVEERRSFLSQKSVAPEELIEAMVLLEENRDALKKHDAVDRVIAQRESSEDHSQAEYFVKWVDLPYSDCTWEARADLSSDADLKTIDDFNDREQAVLGNGGKKRYNPFNTKDERPRFKRMVEQPDFLHGDGRTLRAYQLAGLNFLAFSWTKRNNVILADEMGLGKTLQTISYLGWLMYARNVQGPFLVIVPLSTIAAWVREFARWLPDMNVLCYTGDGSSRGIIRDYEFCASSQPTVEKFHVLLTTPELLMLDQNYLNPIRWATIAVDEAHRLKNEGSSLHLTLAGLRSANRLLVTGTPLQNSVRELWALLHFLNPEFFQDAEKFEESFSFSALRDPERVSQLHKTLRPYIIRRQKSDVEKSLPKKTYAVLRVGMTSAQQQYYRWLLTKNFTKLNMGTKARGVGSTATLRNLVMELKKCCNHPFLFPNYEDTSSPTSVKELIRASGKMILLDKLLVRLREKGHRVLIFSQMVRMLDILQDYCRMRQFPFQRLDGSMPNDVRQRAVDHYNAPDSNDFIFLLSTRAGGLGINLATADTVIIFDSDWNPQNDLQAESRAHRIGQKKDVKVFRLLSRETVEEDILERAKRKRVLEHLVIHGVEGGDQADGKDPKVAFKKEELSAILRFGAEKLFEKDRASGIADPANIKCEPVEDKPTESNADAPTAQDAADDDKDETAEEKRVLEVDDIDELLARAPTDEASQVGAAEPSVGDSLLNAFKWADFKTVEEEDVEEPKDDNKLAEEAASRIVVIDKEATEAQEFEEQERKMLAREGDAEFWDRVIPVAMKDKVVADEVVLGTRRRKRTSTFGADAPKDGKRRRVTRGGRSVNGKVTDPDELTAKEQRTLLRSLRKFGDPTMIQEIMKDAGMEDRIDEDLASSLILDTMDRAKLTVQNMKSRRPKPAKKAYPDDDDPNYGSEDSRTNGKETKGKSNRALFDALGETEIDAADLLKRCEDLQMLRSHIGNFEVDTRFRLRCQIKPPSYNVRWKPQNDAMLLVGVYRYGFGNWTQIACDKQLSLADKMNVAGNSECKPGAPDTTKLTRRVTTLLRELEREVHPPAKKKKTSARDRSENRSTEKKKSSKVSQKKISKRVKDSSRSDVSRGRGVGRSKKNSSSSMSTEAMNKVRSGLKKENLVTLKELRSLSKENNKLNNNEKIKRTKECLLVLGQAIDKLAKIARPKGDAQILHVIRKDLWNYVHEVCRTNLAGGRLQSIYCKLAGIDDDGKVETS